jgi:hypothetical protein
MFLAEVDDKDLAPYEKRRYGPPRAGDAGGNPMEGLSKPDRDDGGGGISIGGKGDSSFGIYVPSGRDSFLDPVRTF